MSDNILKDYEKAIYNASHIVDNKPSVISISPKIDIALGGGVPEGTFFLLTGPPKIGKTTLVLQFCANAQKMFADRNIFYANIEGRLKSRDVEGIAGLNYTDEKFKIIGSQIGNILTGEKYLAILDKIIHTMPKSICIVDSFSALASESELTGDIDDAHVAPMHKYLSNFTKRFANVLPINMVTLVGITHLMANIQSFGKGKTKIEKSGNAVQYAQDVKLFANYKENIMQGDTQIGQKVHWQVENSAIGAPGQKVVSYIKYGRGIWKEYELVELCKDFGIIDGKSWLTLPSGQKFQGMNNLALHLEENSELYNELKEKITEITGI